MDPSSVGVRSPPSSIEVKLGSHEYGRDLWADLEEALKGNLEFKGHFCHVGYDYYAPNPGLWIQGLNQVGIPINSSDARALTGYASAIMPHSLDDESDIRIWEIKENRVKFENPKWESFIQSTVTKVCQALGVGCHIGAITCYWQKLLVSDLGPLSHNFDSKSQEIGTFAKILIALPLSTIVKGEINISIDNQRRTLQFSEEPFSTTIFAWYTGAAAQLTTEKCGSCVFLVYGLAAKQVVQPIPKSPMKSSAFHDIRFILMNWRNGLGYARGPQKKMLVFPLASKYSTTYYSNWLMVNDSNIKARDKIIVWLLKHVAKDLKLPVFFGTVNYTDEGNWNVGVPPPDTDGEDNGPGERSSNGASKYRMNFESIRDADGFNLEGSTITLRRNNLIPRTPFVDSEPEWIDSSDYSHPKMLRRCFLRTAVMITDEESEEGVVLSTRGSYLLKRLGKPDSTNLTPKEHRILDLLVRQFKDLCLDNQAAMVAFSIQRKDFELMKKLIRESRDRTLIFSATILPQLDTFLFKELEPILRNQLEMNSSLTTQLETISTILRRLGVSNSSIIRSWCIESASAILKKIPAKKFQSDYEFLLDQLSRLAANGGTGLILENIVLRMGDCRPSSDFLIKFVHIIHKKNRTLQNQGEVDKIILYSVQYLLQMPIPELYLTASPSKITLSCLRPPIVYHLVQIRAVPRYPKLPEPPKVRVNSDFLDRLGDIIELCTLAAQPTSYHSGLCLLLHTKELDKNRISDSTIISAIDRLQNKDIFQQLVDQRELKPCKTFLRAIIGLYFSEVFKDATCPTTPVALEDRDNFGCDNAQCKACDQVRHFLRDLDTVERAFPMNASEKTHVSPFLLACDLADHTLLTRPSRVRLVKTQNLAETQLWQNRVKKARTFLKTFGNERAVEKITGDMYLDILNALEGVPFRSNEDYRTSLGTLTKKMEIRYPDDEGDEVIDLVDSQSEDEGDAAKSGSKRKRNGGSGDRDSPAKSIRLTEPNT